MNTPKTLLYLSLAVSLWACNAARIPASSENDRKAIMEVLADYRLSINQADTTLGKKVFLTNENISFIHPRGHQHGWKEVKTNIYGMFGSKFSQRDLKSSNETVTLYGDMAVLEFYWVFDAIFAGDNPGKIQTKGRETQVLKKTGKNWKIVHIHYSGMPATQERQGF
ncbi:MAG: hypothetical protein RLZ62_1291 [Bacteroidota bacterium]